MISEELKKYFKNIGYTQEDIAQKLGVKQQVVGILLNGGRPFGANVAKKWSETFGFNISWLLTGEGQMLKDQSNIVSNNSGQVFAGNGNKIGGNILMTQGGEAKNAPQAPIQETNYILVPVYNFDVVGGMDSWNNIIDCPSYIEKYVPFAGASDNDICVHVTGNSMMPAYSAGSLLLVRKVEGWKEYFGYGHVYVLLLKDGRRILKEVQKSEIDCKDYVLCVSYNPRNPSEELPRNFITEVYKVIKTLTNEGY